MVKTSTPPEINLDAINFVGFSENIFITFAQNFSIMLLHQICIRKLEMAFCSSRSLITVIKENYWLENEPIISSALILNMWGLGSFIEVNVYYWDNVRERFNMICVVVKSEHGPSVIFIENQIEFSLFDTLERTGCAFV